MSRLVRRALAEHPEWPAFEPDRHPDTLMWMSRIRAFRRTHAFPVIRHCSVCDSDKPLTEFGRDARKSLGLRHLCRDCDAARSRAYRAGKKRDQFRAILGHVG